MAMINVILGGKTAYNEGGPYVIGGQQSEIDENTPGLEKREIVIDDDREYTVMTEYWLDGELVKRGGHIHLKTGIFAEPFLASFGDQHG